jgi:hypothetical protein
VPATKAAVVVQIHSPCSHAQRILVTHANHPAKPRVAMLSCGQYNPPCVQGYLQQFGVLLPFKAALSFLRVAHLSVEYSTTACCVYNYAIAYARVSISSICSAYASDAAG